MGGLAVFPAGPRTDQGLRAERGPFCLRCPNPLDTLYKLALAAPLRQNRGGKGAPRTVVLPALIG